MAIGTSRRLNLTRVGGGEILAPSAPRRTSSPAQPSILEGLSAFGAALQRQREEELRQQDEMARAAAAMEAERRKQEDEVAAQVAKAQADQAKLTAEALRKGADTDRVATAKAEGAIASRVQEYDEKVADTRAATDVRNAARAAEYNETQANRADDLAVNRKADALERARREFQSMADRVSMHDQQQDLSAQKQRSAGLAREVASTGAVAPRPDGPTPATRQPLLVSESDRELADAVRRGDQGWIERRAQQLLAENPPPQRTGKGPYVEPYREPAKGRILEDYGPGAWAHGRGEDYKLSAEKEWLKSLNSLPWQQGAAEYKAYEAWKAGQGPRPATLPEEASEPQPSQEPPAKAPGVASYGISGGQGGSLPSAAPTAAQRARQRMQRPTPAPVAPAAPGWTPQGALAAIGGMMPSVAVGQGLPSPPPAAAPDALPPAEPAPAPAAAPVPAATHSPSPEAVAAARQAGVETVQQLRQQGVTERVPRRLPTGAEVVETRQRPATPQELAVAEAQVFMADMLARGQTLEQANESVKRFLVARDTAAQGAVLGGNIADLDGPLGALKHTLTGTIPAVTDKTKALAESIIGADPGRPGGVAGFLASAMATAGNEAPLSQPINEANLAPARGAMRGAAGGAVEAAGELLSPADIVTLPLSAGAGVLAKGAKALKAGRLAKTLLQAGTSADIVDLVGSAAIGTQGVVDFVDAAGDNDSERMARAAFFAALGPAGVAMNAKQLKDAYRARARMAFTERTRAARELRDLANVAQAEVPAAGNLLPEGGVKVEPPAEQAKVGIPAEVPTSGTALERVQQVFPRAKVEALPDGRVVVDPGRGARKAEVALDREAVEASRAAKEVHGQPEGEALGVHREPTAERPASQIEVKAGEDKVAVHEAVHYLVSSGQVAKGDVSKMTLRFQRQAAEEMGAEAWKKASPVERAKKVEEVAADAAMEIDPTAPPDGLLGRLRNQLDDYRSSAAGRTQPLERLRAGDTGQSIGSRVGAAVRRVTESPEALGRRRADAALERQSMREDFGGSALGAQRSEPSWRAREKAQDQTGTQASVSDLERAAREADAAVSGEKLPAPVEEARKSLPAVPAGHTRLWRVEGRSAVEAGGAGGVEGGNWFEKSLGAYVTPSTKPENVRFVDVPNERLAQLQSDPNATEVQLPSGYVAQSKRMVDSTTVDTRSWASELTESQAAMRPGRSVEMREKPPKLKGTGEDGRVTLEDVARFTSGKDISAMPEKKQKRLMVAQGVAEVLAQQKQRRSGAGWYRSDIREMEAAAKKAFPELSNPDDMGLFKAIVATTSFGNKPKENLEIAFNVWEQFRKLRDEFPEKQAGDGKNWPGSPGFGTAPAGSVSDAATSRGKLMRLKRETGSWEGVVRWLSQEHSVADIRAMGFDNVAGKPTDMKPGAMVFGPKGGAFYRNISGELGDLTGDMWWTRTFNRWRGTPLDAKGKLPDAPKNEADRRMSREVIEEIARQTGVKPADAQAMLWFHEKDLWGKLAGGEDFGTYSVGGRRALESLREKRATGTTGIAPSPVKAKPANLGVEVAFGENAPLKSKYDWSALTKDQQRAISDDHAKWTIEEVELETGVKIHNVVTGTGPKNWGGNPNAVVRIEGSPEQVRSAARLMGLGLQQDAVAISRPNVKGETPGLDVVATGKTGVPWGRSLLESVRTVFDTHAGGMADHVAIEINVGRDGEPILKMYGIDKLGNQLLDDPAHMRRAKTVLKDALDSLDPSSAVDVRPGRYDLVFEGNDWKENPNGEGYRNGLEEAGHSPEGLDEFVSRVTAAFDETWRRHTGGRPGPEGGEQASVRKPGPPEGVTRGAPASKAGVQGSQGPASREAIDDRSETPIRDWLRNVKEKLKNPTRLFEGDLERMARISSAEEGPAGVKDVGARLAKQTRDALDYMERKTASTISNFNYAVSRFEKAGGNFENVAKALDGQVAVRDLSGSERSMYVLTRSIFNTIKDAARAGETFAGTGSKNYWPHMWGEKLPFDELVDRHARYLVSPEGMEHYRELVDDITRNLKVMDVHQWTPREIAAYDLRKTWGERATTRGRKYAHLETPRKGAEGYRMDADVVRQYVAGAYGRVAQGRYLGRDMDVARKLYGAMREEDRVFAKNAIDGIFRLKLPEQKSVGEKALARGMSELQDLARLTKLGMAFLPQLNQMGVTAAHAFGRAGGATANKAMLQASYDMLRSWDSVQRDAEHSGSLIAHLLGEVHDAWGSGRKTTVQSFFEKITGGHPLLAKGTWGTEAVDRAVRAHADRVGRYVYLDALDRGDRRLLRELLGSDELVDTAMKQQGEAGRLRKLTKELRPAAVGTTAKAHTPRLGRLVTDQAHEMMERAAKHFADVTQYRPSRANQPGWFQHPVARLANTFTSFAHQHWRWQAQNVQGVQKAFEKGGVSAAMTSPEMKTLLAYNIAVAPLVGSALLNARSVLTGRGTDEKETKGQSLGQDLYSIFDSKPIKGEGAWGTFLEGLQGWQYSGGLGYPLTLIERMGRLGERDTEEQLINAAGPSVQHVADTAKLAGQARVALQQKLEGRLSDKELAAFVREVTGYVQKHFTPNFLGVLPAAQREFKGDNVSPGYAGPVIAILNSLGFTEEEIRWSLEHGFTSDRREALRGKREQKRLGRIRRDYVAAGSEFGEE